MGYQHRLYKTKCGHCNTEWLLSFKSWEGGTTLPRTFTCDSCGAWNKTRNPNLFPNIPRVIYCGHERSRQLEIYPYPIEQGESRWALPYSIRSFIYQSSRQTQSCFYSWTGSTEVMGEPAHNDMCGRTDDWGNRDDEKCHLLSGWIRGKDTCGHWEQLRAYCQTLSEQRFLWAYLSLAHGRNFPMLIPQVRIGIAERRRPDFVAFVPLQYLRYQRYAIELDGSHTPEQEEADQTRDANLAAEGFDVVSLRPNQLGYFQEVQKLVERIAVDMSEAERSPWDIATEVEVRETVPKNAPITDEDIPF